MDDVASRAGVSVTTILHVLCQVPVKRMRRDPGELGFVADLLDTATVCRVQPTNTIVTIAGPRTDVALADIVGLVCDTQAVLLAVCDASEFHAAPPGGPMTPAQSHRRLVRSPSRNGPPTTASTSCHSSRFVRSARSDPTVRINKLHADPPSMILTRRRARLRFHMHNAIRRPN
jgi:hypothetical protein